MTREHAHLTLAADPNSMAATPSTPRAKRPMRSRCLPPCFARPPRALWHTFPILGVQLAVRMRPLQQPLLPCCCNFSDTRRSDMDRPCTVKQSNNINTTNDKTTPIAMSKVASSPPGGGRPVGIPVEGAGFESTTRSPELPEPEDTAPHTRTRSDRRAVAAGGGRTR